MVPELPMEISNDLMPSTPEKMPDRLPDFNAAPTGKIDVQSDRQADYDQANNKVIFTGKVELNSAAIRLRADRVEVFMKKGGGGMDRVEASGHVLMRTQDTENGPGQMASAGRASYNLKTGEITLSDWPKIQEAGKSHISTDPSTKMYMFTDGRLRTDGPNRTLIGGTE
jgi:lipopolysaccharide transport protein LptA